MRASIQILSALVALQVVFAVVAPAVTSTQLSQANGDCYLNYVPGRVCDFVYVTAGFSLFFSILLCVGVWASLREGPRGFLDAACAGVALFASFWWMVAAITFTERGQQGTSKGYPGTAARNAVMAMAWLEFVLFLAAGCTVIYDRYAYRRWRILTDHTRSKLEMEEAAQFKQAYATTQVGSIPLV